MNLWSCKLTWICYPQGIGYNEVIENAKGRYKAGEEANYSLEPIKKKSKSQEDKDYELYLKLREKFNPEEYEVAF